MADASLVQSSFSSGEWAPSAQGNIGIPQYRMAMNVCLNGMPIEAGAWTRRPGSICAGLTRKGQPGRVHTFDFTQSTPYNIEMTDGIFRFWNVTSVATTNDDATVSSISAANPAKVATSAAHGWTGTISGFFKNLGVNNKLLQNRFFLATVTSTTEFTLVDEVTGATIDGSTLGSFVSGTFARVQEVASPYFTGAWATTRVVQTMQSDGTVDGVLLNSAVAPYVLTVPTLPTSTALAQFALNPANFTDGPYFDAFKNGVQATPSATTGIINLTLAFPAYTSTVAYKKGDFVTDVSINYISKIDQNQNNTPASSPTAWAVTSAGAAIGPNGFLGSDIGRAVRLSSEPPIWAVGTSYAQGAAVSYAGVVWSSLVGANVGNVPGIDLAHWQINPTGVQWTWGKITSLLNQISQTLASSVAIGTMTGGGNLAASFDGITNQQASACSSQVFIGSNGPYKCYVGKDYHSASAQKIASATVYPSSDLGFWVAGFGGASQFSFTARLRAKATAPANSSDGTLLGSQVFTFPTINSTAPIVIASSDQTTPWNYVWVEFEVDYTGSANPTMTIVCSEVQFFLPPGTGTTTGVQVQILGPALLYTTPIRTWRLGLYSNTTGWPTCGTYHEGRLWLSGLVGNRIDGGVPNDTFNFKPTEQDGTVTDSNGIAYTFNSPDINPIYSMTPDHQGIICGTQAGEWLVQATTLNAPLTPTSIQAHRVTKVGNANIEPRRTDHTLVFVQKYSRKLIEYFADVFSGKFAAPNLSKFVKHIMVSGIQEIAYQQELVPLIWARMGDGSLLSCTYQRDSLMSSQGPTIMGWARHTLGSGRAVESITVGPSSGGNLSSLAMVTNDAGTNVRHVEVLSNFPDDNLALANAWHLDDAIVPSSTQNVTISGTVNFQMNGLWPLNGKTVLAFAGGLYLGSFTVSNGTVNVPYGSDPSGLFTAAFVAGYTGTMPVVVGFGYNSDGQIVRPMTKEESGARNGPAFGKIRRSQSYAIQFLNAQNVSVGTDFTKLNAANFRTAPDGGNALPITSMKSGLHISPLTDDNPYDSMLCWRVSGPYPATVVIVGQYLHTQDK